VHNVGAIFRTADGAGVSKIFLSGYTPAPVDRFGRVVEKMQKTSLGATDMVSYEQCEDTLACIMKLKGKGVRVIALEQCPDSVSYTNVTYTGDVAFVVGNEVEGVPPSVCEACDVIVHIPMHGKKESLNVSTATGIILFHAASITKQYPS
jgi:tRNA G18 (ribose-2'-O)-methylase SpoU